VVREIKEQTMPLDPKVKKPKKDTKKSDKPKKLSDSDMDRVAGGRDTTSDGKP
jgi:hypothetical protein